MPTQWEISAALPPSVTVSRRNIKALHVQNNLQAPRQRMNSKSVLLCLAISLACFCQKISGFTGLSPHISSNHRHHHQVNEARPQQFFAPLQSSNNDNPDMEEKFGGYTVKQRLREEVESPFRTVRLFFFGISTGSALLALYFSATNVAKAMAGMTSGPPLDESLQSCAINVAAVLLCGFVTYRDYNAGEANLARIAKGGALAKLVVANNNNNELRSLKDYRRNARVLICAGGPEYIQTLARTLTSDERSDENQYPQLLEASDVIVIPVLLENEATRVGDTSSCWKDTTVDEDKNRNFDITKSDNVVVFPVRTSDWMEYLESEVETAKKQGFDVMSKGFTITVKKNGRILRRATGQPQWQNLIDTMEVLDGSKFGMPGDSEKYGGPP